MPAKQKTGTFTNGDTFVSEMAYDVVSHRLNEFLCSMSANDWKPEHARQLLSPHEKELREIFVSDFRTRSLFTTVDGIDLFTIPAGNDAPGSFKRHQRFLKSADETLSKLAEAGKLSLSDLAKGDDFKGITAAELKNKIDTFSGPSNYEAFLASTRAKIHDRPTKRAITLSSQLSNWEALVDGHPSMQSYLKKIDPEWDYTPPPAESYESHLFNRIYQWNSKALASSCPSCSFDYLSGLPEYQALLEAYFQTDQKILREILSKHGLADESDSEDAISSSDSVCTWKNGLLTALSIGIGVAAGRYLRSRLSTAATNT